jgi:hypothetical protein
MLKRCVVEFIGASEFEMRQDAGLFLSNSVRKKSPSCSFAFKFLFRLNQNAT